jgi:16S rRNA (adenine1518-N6/adenine1519-N6)-dimethyltransferase
MLNHRPRKQFGQNFLVDRNITDKILKKADLKPEDIVLEIGPGKGFLTDALLAKVAIVLAIEIDKDLIDFLSDKYTDKTNFFLIKGDCLKKDWFLLEPKIMPNKLIANIPYNITSQIIFKLFEYLENKNFEKIILMMQNEVADRITSSHNNKVYGVLSCVVQKFWKVEKFCKLPPTVFYPAPNVESALVEFIPKTLETTIDTKTIFDYIKFIKFCFMQRRKVLFQRIIKNYEIDRSLLAEFYSENKLNLDARPENINVDLFWELFMKFQFSGGNYADELLEK